MKTKLVNEVKTSLQASPELVSMVLCELIIGRKAFGTILTRNDENISEKIHAMSNADVFFYFGRNSHYFKFSKDVLRYVIAFEKEYYTGNAIILDKMIQQIAKISGLSEILIKAFFDTWEGFYEMDNGISAEDYATIISQHYD